MTIDLEPYLDQLSHWPTRGRHILASYDDESIVVYQAYAPDIADYAVAHQRFGGRFSLGRMSWIKPNFLWMMYRSGWATKEGQERILAVRLPRRFFDELLACAVPSLVAGGEPEVRLQWDPDHDPAGAPQERRALQLGLRGEMLRRYATVEVRGIEDITAFVAEQRGRALDQLLVPCERVYRILFYRTGDPFGELSNFAAFPIEIDGVRWPTSEHYFQAQKFASEEDREAIRSEPSPMKAAAMGRDRGRVLRPDWDGVKDEVMLRALRAKFAQHPSLAAMLLATGDAEIVEHTANDRYWADGGDGSGRNRLGELLMNIRSELATSISQVHR